ncbi:hypothetical protein E2C01_094382 [Portunus trituberculatus]|uniref:Uncharacterized protein n=1 Tax=Portunus trituberculatus TaxID=210409 RepID=A0A5B7JQA4_PORTR|nr:hypothetical protein [Portunus trituberculatus]
MPVKPSVAVPKVRDSRFMFV